jgi:hypothetical protein
VNLNKTLIRVTSNQLKSNCLEKKCFYKKVLRQHFESNVGTIVSLSNLLLVKNEKFFGGDMLTSSLLSTERKVVEWFNCQKTSHPTNGKLV